MNEQFKIVRMEEIVPSPTNPRREFDEESIKELAQSISEHGLIQPIILREINAKNQQYEIIVGERRFRAMKLLERDEIAAIVREISDESVLEIQIIENLQRKDIHPMDESVGFLKLKGKMPTDIVAQKVGKSLTYIYQRIQLSNLTKELKTLFYKGEINLGHAILLCRLSIDSQEILMNWMDENTSVGSLKDHIKCNFMLKLVNAPWDMHDEMLIKKAGACSFCEKRTQFIPDLFPEIEKDDLCTDVSCFNKKQQAILEYEIELAKKEKRELLKLSTSHLAGEGELKYWQYTEFTGQDYEEEHYVEAEAVFANGDDIGKKVIVLIGKVESDEPEKELSEQEIKEHEYEALKNAVDSERWEKFLEILKKTAVSTIGTKLDSEMLLHIFKYSDSGNLLDYFFNNAHYIGVTIEEGDEELDFEDKLKRFNELLPTIVESQFVQVLFISLADDLFRSKYDVEDINNFARDMGIDIEKIEKEVEKSLPYPEGK